MKYCPKHQEFDYVQMIARTALAAFNHNHNSGREQKVNSQVEPSNRFVFPKAALRWIAKPVYEDKSYDHLWKMIEEVVDQQENRLLSLIAITKRGNIAKISASPKEELLEKQFSVSHNFRPNLLSIGTSHNKIK